MAAALVPLQNITLGSAQSTVTFASIPGTYRDLRLVSNFSGASNMGDIYIRFNGSSTNYSNVEAWGNGSATGSATPGTTGAFFSYYVTAANLGTVTSDVFDYAQTNKHKSALTRCSLATQVADVFASRWADTSAITSLAIVCSANTFAAGSTFALYGVVA